MDAPDVSHESAYFVMDSRALYDVGTAAILASCGHRRPKWKHLRRDWRGQKAVLVRCFGYDGHVYTQSEAIGVII